ncbi:IolE protein [Actinomycetospora sp. NBRC 106378]|nr:IolE protein [Actinomycetospora sp. NBRC 106378]
MAGFDWIEIGPYGYLPTDPAELSDSLARHGLQVSAGTVFEALHRENSWADVWKQVTEVAALTRAVGGELTVDQWDRMTSGIDELGRRILEQYGLDVQFHPHADSHVGHQPEIERFLDATDSRYVNLCLATGHVAYYRGDCVDLIERFAERIGYVHLKQVDPAIRAQVEAEDLGFPEAVRRGVMIEPPYGGPHMRPVLDAVAGLGRDIYPIVEQDMYPCHPDTPPPIAQRTRTYLAGCGVIELDIAHR